MSLAVLAIPSQAQQSSLQGIVRQDGELNLTPVEKPTCCKYDGNTVWFFNIPSEKEGTKPLHYRFRNDTLVVYDSRCVRKCHMGGERLSMFSFETPQVKISYDTPVPLLSPGIIHGESISVKYTATGKYCERYQLSSTGKYSMKSEERGSIVEGKDTVQNVLLMHDTDTSLVSFSIPSEPSNRCKVLRKVEESFLWVDSATRVPLFESRTLALYDGLLCLFTEENTFRLEFQGLVDVEESQDVIISSESTLTAGNSTDTDTLPIINYSVIQNGAVVTLNYSLTERADIHALLCDTMGMVYHDEHQSHDSGDGYSFSFNISSLRTGNYIIYLNVNGSVCSTTIRI